MKDLVYNGKDTWRMTQSWHNLMFAHWPADPAQLHELVPAPLEIDTFEGQAWVGIVAFRLDHIRLRGLPETPFVRGFAELNVRTYVRLGDRHGVLFLSLDTDHLFTIGVARPWFHLPYRVARVHFAEDAGHVRFSSHRADADFAAAYEPIGEQFEAAAGSLEGWLTERYCYFAPVGDALYRCDIAHPHWRLQRARAKFGRNTMLQLHGLRVAGAPLLHYANYMNALIWPVRRVARMVKGERRVLSALPAWA